MRDASDRIVPSSPGPAAEGNGPPVCRIRVIRRDDWSAVLMRGDLDLSAQPLLERHLRAELRFGRSVIVELGGLEFTDVSGIRTLQKMIAHAASLTPPVPIELHGAHGQVARLMRRLGLGGELPPSPKPSSVRC